MSKLIKMVVDRQHYLNGLLARINKELQNAPENRIRIDCSGNKARYCEVNKQSRVIRYLSEQNIDLIRELAQKSYDKRVLRTLRQELNAIEHMLRLYPRQTIEELYALLRKKRQDLVTPIVETKEEMARSFRAQEFEPNPIPVGDTGLETDRGEIVRSRAEYIIANDINRTEAEYHYEKPLFLEGWGTVWPDFTILNVRTGKTYYWEHLGRTNDLGYVQKNIRKIEAYAKNGYYPGEKLILSSETVDPETGEVRIDKQLIRQLVRKYCT